MYRAYNMLKKLRGKQTTLLDLDPVQQDTANKLIGLLQNNPDFLTDADQLNELMNTTHVSSILSLCQQCQYITLSTDKQIYAFEIMAPPYRAIPTPFNEIQDEISPENCIALIQDKSKIKIDADFYQQESVATATMSCKSTTYTMDATQIKAYLDQDYQNNTGKNHTEILGKQPYQVESNIISDTNGPIAKIQETSRADLFKLTTEPNDPAKTQNFFYSALCLASTKLASDNAANPTGFNRDAYTLTINLRKDVPVEQQADRFLDAYFRLTAEASLNPGKLEPKINITPKAFLLAVQTKLQSDLQKIDLNSNPQLQAELEKIKINNPILLGENPENKKRWRPW